MKDTSVLKRSLSPSNNLLYWFVAFWVCIYGLIIIQDYIYSTLKGTGFYWPEVTLFNIYWLLFIPFSFGLYQLTHKKVLDISLTGKSTIVVLLISGATTMLHILAFSLLIALISNLIFDPSHRFTTVLNTSISNDFLITFITYSIIPFIYQYFDKTSNPTVKNDKTIDYLKSIKVKKGNTYKAINLNDVLYFSSSKPYTIVHTQESQYLINNSLKSLQCTLDPTVFMRGHKSYIFNSQKIKEVSSRGNGDYDLTVQSGDQLRLSRHYRQEWEHLIQTYSS